MGILLIISQSHLFSFVLFPFFIFLLFPLYPGTLWSTPLLIWFLYHWSSCILWFHILLCDTYDTVIANKFNPIMCVGSFPTFTGFHVKRLLSSWWLWGIIYKFLYQCHTEPLIPICNLCVIHHLPPSPLFPAKTWYFPLWWFLKKLLLPVKYLYCWSLFGIFVVIIDICVPFESVNCPLCVVIAGIIIYC